jgi:hypothetical protein
MIEAMSTPTREQFVDQVLKVVAERFPLVKAARGDEPFSMRVNGNLASLENLYRVALLSPENAKHQIERWVVELIRAGEGTPDRGGTFEDLRERIMPIILTEERADDESTVSQPLVEGLRVGYAIDGDRTIAHIPHVQFKEWGVTIDDLHDAAIENLTSRSEAMKADALQDEGGQVYMIVFQTLDGYDASRVLLPTLHSRLSEYLGSPFCAAIPSRDVLLCFREDTENVEKLREQIAADHARLPHGITDQLLLVTPDGIAPRT